MGFKPVRKGGAPSAPRVSHGRKITKLNAWTLPSTPRPERIRIMSPDTWAEVERIRRLSPALSIVNVVASALSRGDFREEYIGGELSMLGRTEYTRIRLADEEVVPVDLDRSIGNIEDEQEGENEDEQEGENDER